MRSLTALLCLVAATTTAQPSPDTVLTSPFSQLGGSFGSAIAFIDDIDGDGEDDLVVAARGEDGGSFHSGQVHVFSGRSLSLLYSVASPFPEDNGGFGLVVSPLSDLDADGRADFVVGARWEMGARGRAYVFSGAAGRLLHTLQSPQPSSIGMFGIEVSSIPDIDGDAVGDIVIGSLDEVDEMSHAGRVYIFSGKTGLLIHELQSPAPEWTGYFGRSLSPISDQNADGIPDLAVGADAEGSNVGRVYLFSGSDGELIQTIENPSQDPGPQGFGSIIDETTDRNKDGVREFLISAPGKANGTGVVFLISGANGQLLETLLPPNPESSGHFGVAIDQVDLDDDASEEIVIGSSHENNFDGVVRIYDGETFSLLSTLTPTTSGLRGYFGDNIAVSSDPGDMSRWSVMISADDEDDESNANAGRVYLYASSTIVAHEIDTLPDAEALQLRVAPNPASDYARVGFQLNHATSVLVELFDTLGRRVATYEARQFSPGRHELIMNTADLPRGVYVLRLYSSARDVRAARLVTIR